MLRQEMADISSSSSDHDAPVRRSSHLNADRGVIKRETWATESDKESESSDDSETEDEVPLDESDEDVPLTQRDVEEASDSDEETEDEEDHVNEESPKSLADKVINSEDGMESSSEESERNVEDENHVKSEQDDEVESDEGEVNRTEELSLAGLKDTEETESEDGDEEVQRISTAEHSNHGVGEEDKNHAADNGTEIDAVEQPDRKTVDEEEKDSEEVQYLVDEQEDEIEEDDGPTRNDVDAARKLMGRIGQAHLSFTEQSELHKGKMISGPPIDRSISQADQWKRKYRWPVALRNVRRRRYVANAEELASDYDLRLVSRRHTSSTVSSTARNAFAVVLAPTVRPLMSAALVTIKEQNEKRDREMKFVERLEETKESDPNVVDATHLRILSRLGGHFTDQLLDSILVKNVLALQGLDASYAQQCWDPLPTSKRPVANWRFVLEHFCRTSTHGVDAHAISSAPRLRKDTLVRIRDRLKTLYGVSWRPEDDAFFNLVDQQAADPPEPSELYRL